MIKFSIYKKMMFGFSAIISIMIISSGYILFALNSVASDAKAVLASNVQSLSIARALQSTIQDEDEYIEKYLVSEDETYYSLFAETSKLVSDKLARLEQEQSSSKNIGLIDDLQTFHQNLVQAILDKPATKSALEQSRKKNISGLSEGLKTLIGNNQSFIVEKMSDMEKITAQAVKVAVIVIFGTLMAAIGMALGITQTITRPISDLILGTRQIAKGDFKKIAISSRDEMALLADAINDMGQKINESNTLKTHMMQQISHEIKTPLQAILASHDLLKVSGRFEEKQQHLLETIKRSVNSISDHSRQYLDLAKIQSGAVQYHMQLSDLCDIVSPIVDDARIIALSKNIDIKTTFNPTPALCVDKEKISILISNLISNAIKYTQDSGKISVTISPCDIGAQVEVCDSGIGIDADEIPKIFIRFYQARTKNKFKSQGSGVGLAIVKAYAEGHAGKLQVNSTPDKGSSFIVQLPLNSKNPATDVNIRQP